MKKYRWFLLALFSGVVAGAQENVEKSAATLVESRQFVFKAESVSPPRGRFTQLTSTYDLVVAGDSVTAFLPYFGRAYTAPINPSEGGIKFSSNNVEYKATPRRKNGWEIEIRPKDAQDVQVLYLTVFANKRASLRVNSTNRESISYNGYISWVEPRKKKAF